MITLFVAAAAQQQAGAALSRVPSGESAAERARRHIEAASNVVARTIGEAFSEPFV